MVRSIPPIRVSPGFDALTLRNLLAVLEEAPFMLSLPLPVRIFLCSRHADLRKKFAKEDRILDKQV